MEADKETMVRAILLLAKKRGREWLDSEHERVTLATLSGATTIKSLSFEGGSASGDSEISVVLLMDILTAALERFDAGSETSVASGGMLVPRIYSIPH